jgi:hypothetical protein
MERFLSYFVGFQQGFYETAGRHLQKPFILSVDSNLILFGFDGKKFFEEEFESEVLYYKHRAELKKRLPTPRYFRAGRRPRQEIVS